MAVYLGSAGIVELRRTGEGSFRSVIDPADVNVTERRFSFDFPNGTFLTGDRLVLRRVTASGGATTAPLDFIAPTGWGDGQLHSDGAWFAHVDPLGGIRLYATWADALAGRTSNAVALNVPGSSYPIVAELEVSVPHCLGQIAEYSISTNRATVDTTSLGDAFAQSVSGLISGSGEIRCFWDWRPSTCAGIGADQEVAHYLHQLILRQQLGSEFKANLYVKRAGSTPQNDTLPAVAAATALYYEVTAIVTDVGIAFDSGEALESTIEFVTTGEIALRYGLPTAYYLLQEDGGKLRLEDGGGFVSLETDL